MAQGDALPTRQPSAAGPIHYVDNVAGSDSNTKNQAQSESTPWATVDHAIGAGLSPGDRVWVKNGNGIYTPAGVRHDATASGTAQAPIQLRAYPGHTPIIRQGTNDTTGAEALRLSGANYWRIGPNPDETPWDGHLIFQRPGASLTVNAQALYLGANTTHVEVAHNELTNQQKGTALFTAETGSFHHIIGNHIHGIGVSGTQYQAIYVTSDDSAVYNNWVHDLYQGFGIQIRTNNADPAAGPLRIIVANNTVHDIRAEGAGGGGTGLFFEDAVRDGWMVNNISYDNDNRGIDGLHGGSQSTTLTAGIDNLQTTITVTSAANFPSSGSYYILIGTEILQVTGGQGTTTWTVARGQLGSSAASAANGATLRLHLAQNNVGRRNLAFANGTTQFSHSTNGWRIINWDGSGGYTFGAGPGDNLAQAPVFVDYAGLDLRLTANSPGANYGLLSYTPLTDFYGNARSDATIGAFAAPSSFTPAVLGGAFHS